MKNFLDRLLPKYARLPLLLAVLFNCIVYYLTTLLLPPDLARYDFSFALDGMLPLVPFFVLFYVLAYIQWFGSYFYHSRAGAQICYRIAMANMIAKSIGLICFLLLPARIQRPEILGDGFFEWGTRLIYSLDEPVNLLPSFHCLESWLAFRGAMMLPKKNSWYIAGQGIFSLLVFASTVLIKQHYVIDIPAGILACEIGLQLAGRLKFWRFFEFVQLPSVKADLKARQK